MVSRRFRNRVNLTGASPEAIVARIETLEENDAQLYRDDLALVAEQADAYDKEIRLAAISKLEHLPSLAELLENSPDIAEAAANSIARLIAKNPAGAHDSLLASQAVKLAFIRASRDPHLVQDLLNQLEIDQLVDLAQTATHPGVRRAAAERVQDEGALSMVASNAKNHDKSVFRLARTRLDRIRSARRVIAEAEQRASSIADRLAELSELPLDRTFVPRLKIIQQEWQECQVEHRHALESEPQLASECPDQSSSDTYAKSLQRAESRVRLEQATGVEPSVQQDAPETTPEAQKPAPEISTSLSAKDLEFLQSSLSRPAPEFFKPESVEDHKELWQELRRWERIYRRLENSLRELQASANPAQAELAVKVHSWLSECAAYNEACRTLQETLLESFHARFKQLTERIELGKLGSASDLRRACGDALRMLPEPQAQKLWKQLHETDSSIQQLRDWQSYAATPKREALCERMAEIAESPLEVEEQLDLIRVLREEWKALGPLTGGRDHELRRRFEKLADTAFAPCRAHFQEQAELRKRNLSVRRQLCADLELFIQQKDWSNPDWKALDRILRTARSEWRAAHPVDRTKIKALQQRFDELCEDIYRRLSAHWKSNEIKARALIVELRALLDSTSSLERLAEGTSAIQARWREVGPMSHSANRKLWKEFRGLCDQVYSQRRVRWDQENEAYRDKLERATQLVASLESKLDQATLESVSTGELNHLGEEWEAFKNTPGESFKRLNNRWRDLTRRYRQMLREGDLARQLRLLDLASRLDSGLCKSEQAFFDSGDGPDDSSLASLTQDAKSLFGKLPLARLDCLGQGIATGQDDIATKIIERRRMCITLDIYADRESPQEDKALRLEIQVDRINQGAGSTRHLQEEPLKIARSWCQIGPVGTEGEALNERFFSALKQMTQ